MRMLKYRDGNGKDATILNKTTNVLFVIYLIALFWILLFKLGVRFSYMGNRSANLIPFSEFLIPNSKIDIGEVILNAVIFVPLGIYAGLLFKRRTWGNKLLFFFLISLMFEGLQYIFKIGAFDITDIITNLLGGIAGLMILKGIEKLFNNSVKSQKFINIIATIGTIAMISLLLLLKLNMLPIRYQ
jgi:glycopeptide antibiotics resistance protein